ncbi:hypothetical protein OPV22_017273 [Ensete ventricosum]|uniref:Scarecrow-like protein 9 n=1 Tax=Ensete ventricosum TaxID=4639 RepID=A0AAV8R1T5_ENSVE|nr:hypothetical protein OPV22_017273 [Ensete ventricosum]
MERALPTPSIHRCYQRRSNRRDKNHGNKEQIAHISWRSWKRKREDSGRRRGINPEKPIEIAADKSGRRFCSQEGDEKSVAMGTGIRDLRGVMNGFKHDQLFPDPITANGLKLKGLPPPTTAAHLDGFIDMQDGPFLQAPSDSALDAIAPPSFLDDLFTEEDALNSLDLGGQQQSSNLADDHPGLRLSLGTPNANLSPGTETDTLDDSEIFFSDIGLNYISQMLMEENIDDKFDVYLENPALFDAENPFFEILGENFTASPGQPPLCSSHFSDSSDGNHHGSSGSSTVMDNSQLYDASETHPVPIDDSPQSSFSSVNSFGDILERVEESLLSTLVAPDLPADSQPAWQFQRGIEEAHKFLPSDDKLVINIEHAVEVKAEGGVNEHAVHPSRGRKNRHGEDLDLEEGRSIKQSAVFSEETRRTKLFDEVLLCNEGNCAKAVDKFRERLQNEASKVSHGSHSRGRKGRGKKQPKREVVDLRTLLTHCAQAVAADDHRSANELLKQIRQHSSPFGDANQRLAHWFADGLQARLAGTGSQIYHSLTAKRIPVTDVLKAFQLYTAVCPFRKVSHFFSTQTILNVAEKATRLHIIDFGMYYGFQWPCFLQRLSYRPDGPPKVRMTGIELPVHGFRPTELIDETGRRLADYASSFRIPFEFRSIAAAKWDDIGVEDLDLRDGEVVVVNCLYRFKNLLDETLVVDNPRDKVLNTIRKINPDVFIHGVVNGTYSAPFFVTRFREALFHYSSMFDMIETNAPQEDESRQLIEKVLFGREALNIIACEGTERLERPETYKQWHVRNLRAGFVQLPLNPDIVKKATDKVKSCYHKDFVVDEDNRWLLQGWKGRIIYALSTWKSNSSY